MIRLVRIGGFDVTLPNYRVYFVRPKRYCRYVSKKGILLFWVGLAGIFLTAAENIHIGGKSHHDYKHPAISPDGKWIAYFGNRNSQGDIYIAPNTNSSQEEFRLTFTDNAFQSQPSFWLDNYRISFFSTESGRKGIYVVDRRAPQKKNAVTDLRYWCESARYVSGALIYCTRRKKRFDIYLMDLKNKKETPLVSDGNINLTPDMDAAKRNVVFASNRSGAFHLWLLKRVTGQVRQLTHVARGNFSPIFSPDGKEILYTTLTSGGNDIWVINVKSGKRVQVTSHPARDITPAWGPEGAWIYFASNRSGKFKIYRKKIFWRKP